MDSGWPTIKTNEDARVAREENGVVLRTTFILISSILVFATPIGLIITASSTDFISPSHRSNTIGRINNSDCFILYPKFNLAFDYFVGLGANMDFSMEK